jgi:hypothetical protein
MPDTTRKLLAIFALSLFAELPEQVRARAAYRLRQLSGLAGKDGDSELQLAGESLADLVDVAPGGVTS